MKKAVIAIIIYFPLVLIYKLFGDSSNNYWVNAYWLAVSLVYILLFIGISKMFSLINLIHDNDSKFYTTLSLVVSGYWVVMAIIRLYLFFDIDKHREVICSAGKITTGSVCILFMFIFLMAKKWYKK